MAPWVLNEYIHLDEAELTEIGWWAEYEPFDYPVRPFTLRGHIYIDGEPICSIRCGTSGEHLLLVGSDDIQHAGFKNNAVCLLWKSDPGEHFLCISYEVMGAEIEITPQWSWMQEGF